jgi:hypothetical protein
MENINMLSKLDEAIRINRHVKRHSNGDISTKQHYGSDIINEIEYHLFYIQNKDRNIFIDRILSRVFYNKMYLLQLDSYKIDDIDSELEKKHENLVIELGLGKKQGDFIEGKSMGIDEIEIFYDIKYVEDFNYIGFICSFIRDLKDIIQSFGLSFDNEKYPLNRLINLDLIDKEIILTKRIPKNKFTEQQATDLHNGLCKEGLIQSDIDSFLFWFGVTDNSENVKPLEWTKSKALLAYFVDGITEKYNLKHGEKRMIKPFETMFKTTGITHAINDYKKTGDSPVGYKDIDKLL